MYLVGVEADGKNEQELGYWRKHPNLHGFIVNTFANGVDDCRKIYLDKKQVTVIMESVKNSGIARNSGFLFGRSFGDETDDDLIKLKEAILWLDSNPDRKVYYQASW